MASLEWSDALSLDLPLMDNTHSKFVDLLAMAQHSPDEGLAAARLQLIDHNSTFWPERSLDAGHPLRCVELPQHATHGGTGGDA